MLKKMHNKEIKLEWGMVNEEEIFAKDFLKYSWKILGFYVHASLNHNTCIKSWSDSDS